MISTPSKPSLSQLNRFIDKVDGFPVSAKRLVEIARSSRTPKSVYEFYGSFADDQVFESKEELTARSEQVEMMRSLEPEMPREEFVAPEED